MISNQILQNTIDGLKNITRTDLCVIDVEGKILAATFPDAEQFVAPAQSFVGSPADSQVVNGCQFFKVFDDHQLEYILPVIDLAQGDMLLVALFGGVFSGAGMGMVLRANATTGGTDMVAALIQLKIRHYNVAQIMQVLDGAIVILGFFVFGLRPSLYAIVAIFVTTKVSDAILEGFKYSKAAYIITDKYEEVAKVLMEELDRGATGLKATGMYTGKDRCVLYCVVSKKQIVTLKEIVVNIDPKAFVIVSDVREVLGEGFLDYKEIGAA